MPTTPHTTTQNPTTTATASRRYGRNYPATATLPLPELAVLITADLIRLGQDDSPDDGTGDGSGRVSLFPDRVRYVVDTYSRDSVLHVQVLGLTDAELAQPYVPAGEHACPADYAEIIATVADSYGWWSAEDPDDRRFGLRVTLLDEATQKRQGWRAVTVSDLRDVPTWLQESVPGHRPLDTEPRNQERTPAGGQMKIIANHYTVTTADGTLVGRYNSVATVEVARVAAEHPGCTVTATYPGKPAETRCPQHPAFTPDNCPRCGTAQRRMGF